MDLDVEAIGLREAEDEDATSLADEQGCVDDEGEFVELPLDGQSEIITFRDSHEDARLSQR